MSKSPYNFEKNILGLSSPGMTIDRLPEEWIHVLYEESVDSQVKCICNHVIRYVNRYLNTRTQRMINVGTGCIKKFHLAKCKSAKTLLTNLIIGIRGDYQKIFDLIQYSDENWITFLESIKSNAISEWDNLAGLNEISEIQARLDKKAELAETHRKWTEQLRLQQEQIIAKQRRTQQERRIADLEFIAEQRRLEEERRHPLTLQRLRRVEELRSYVNKAEARFTRD